MYIRYLLNFWDGGILAVYVANLADLFLVEKDPRSCQNFGGLRTRLKAENFSIVAFTQRLSLPDNAFSGV